MTISEEAQACSGHAAEVAEHLGALAALVAEPPFELREVLELWDGPIPGGSELWELLDICRAHLLVDSTIRKNLARVAGGLTQSGAPPRDRA